MRWTGTRALLLVHGVGNAREGDYAELVRQIETLLGDEARSVAIYTLYYDQVNDWFMEKQRTALLLQRLLQALRSLLAATPLAGAVDPVGLGNTLADAVADVVWPVLLADARNAVRAAVIAQLQQIVRDGAASGVPFRDQRVSILAHSLGCFHVYEALHSVAADARYGLGPATGTGPFDNVIFMASPVQLIRGVASSIAGVIPQPESVRTISQPLGLPVQVTSVGSAPCVNRVLSITGNLDPIGGNFFRARPAWAYTELPGQDSIIDQQQLAAVNGSDELALKEILRAAWRDREPPHIAPVNPHAWSEYVRRHADVIRERIVA